MIDKIIGISLALLAGITAVVFWQVAQTIEANAQISRKPGWRFVCRVYRTFAIVSALLSLVSWLKVP